jgi:ArsR family transcriptional regulator
MHLASMDFEIATKRLEALGNGTRLAIFRLLVSAGQDGLAVAQIQERLGIPTNSLLSHHLHRLVEAGLVTKERRRTTLLCRAEGLAVMEVAAFLTDGVTP